MEYKNHWAKPCLAFALAFSLLSTFIGCGPKTNPEVPVSEDARRKNTPGPINLSAVWGNSGEDKVTRQEVRASINPNTVLNRIWDGKRIKIFGAKNEMVSFNLIIESGTRTSKEVSVTLSELVDANGNKISSSQVQAPQVFDWTTRDIELFYVKYLPIKGLSKLGYEQYDERHIPHKLRRPWSGAGIGTGSWLDRPFHDQDFPDIAVPLEAVPRFEIGSRQSQSIWSDIYIAKGLPAGVYQGTIKVFEGTHLSFNVPVSLEVRSFTLPDVPNSKSMLYLGYADIANRYLGQRYPTSPSDLTRLSKIRDKHFQMAKRHKISLIDNNDGTSMGADRPTQEWIPRLNGTLYSAAQGYRGPGENIGNGIFSIGTYGTWDWQALGRAGMWSHSDSWVNWFLSNSPGTETFLYLIDESSNYSQIETWASDLLANPGAGRSLASFATLPLPSSQAHVPSLGITTSTMDVGDTLTWSQALSQLRSTPSKKYMHYNGKHPASGSFMVDDDGVALREIPWGQFKKGIDRWFYWESTYYNDFQGGRGETRLFSNAQTFGAAPHYDSILGQTSGLYSNGDGVLFYPGTDLVYPTESLALEGPVASLRLKHWRRGIQDVDYLTMAKAIDPTRVNAIVNSMVPSILWENGVADPGDPTWIRCDLGWEQNPDAWDLARSDLADIIEGH